MELLNKSLEDGRHLMEEISTDMASIKKVDGIEVSKSKVQMTPSRCRFFPFSQPILFGSVRISLLRNDSLELQKMSGIHEKHTPPE